MARFDLGKNSGWSSSFAFQHCWKSAARWIVWTFWKHSPGGRLILDVFQTDASECTIPCTCARCCDEYKTRRPGRCGSRAGLAFPSAGERNDVEMIFSIRHPTGVQKLVFLGRCVFLPLRDRTLPRDAGSGNVAGWNFDRTPIRMNRRRCLCAESRQGDASRYPHPYFL